MFGVTNRRVDPRHALGARGERMAARFLRRQGFRILARNVRDRAGEIDLIAEKAGGVHFVEVKTRAGDTHGQPEEAVGDRKQARARRTAAAWLKRFRLPPERLSFDIIGVTFEDGNPHPRVQWSPEAF